MSQIATLACVLGIAFLFHLNRNQNARTSQALWIPVVWLLIAGSRNVSEWLQLSGPTDAVDRYIEGSPLDRNILTVLLLAGLITLGQREGRVRAILKHNIPILLYFAYCGISIIWSDYPFVGLKRWIRGLGDVIMVLVILTETDWLAAVKRTLATVGFVLIPVSILLIRYFPDLGRAYGNDGSLYWTGVATGKNSLGMICLIFGLAAVWQFLLTYSKRANIDLRRRRLAQCTIIVMATWLLLIADSKTSLACFVLVGGVIAVTWLTASARRPAVLHLMVGAIVLASFAVLFLGVGGGALERIGRDASLTGRTDVWRLVLGFVESPVFGEGYEGFWMGKRLEEIVRQNGGVNQAHNGYIEVYLNLGAVGVGLLAALIITSYQKIISGFRRYPEICILRIAYFTIALVYNFTEGAFKMMSPVWIAFIFAIMAVPHVRPAKRRSSLPIVPLNALEGLKVGSAN